MTNALPAPETFVFIHRLIYNALPLLLPPPQESALCTNSADPKLTGENRLFHDLESAKVGLARYVWVDARAQAPGVVLPDGRNYLGGGIVIRSVDAGLRSGFAQQAFVRPVLPTLTQ